MERVAEATLFLWVFGCGFLVVVGGELSHVNTGGVRAGLRTVYLKFSNF